jgi:hypothetical protein
MQSTPKEYERPLLAFGLGLTSAVARLPQSQPAAY